MAMSTRVPAMTQQQRILVVDDDAEIRFLISDYLTRAGYRVDTAGDSEAMWQQIALAQPSLIVLDVMLPGEDGLSLCRRLQQHGRPPVIMLSALDTSVDRIVGLEMGADDYLAKPFDPRELLARVKALLRRTLAQNDGAPEEDEDAQIVDFEGWRLDRRRAQLTSPRGTRIDLGRTDHRVLCALLDRANREVSREYLVEHIYRKDYLPTDRAIDMSISRLRRHLDNEPGQSQLIRTVRHIGYMLAARVVRAV